MKPRLNIKKFKSNYQLDMWFTSLSLDEKTTIYESKNED